MGTPVKNSPPRFVHMDTFVRYAWDFLQHQLQKLESDGPHDGDTLGEFWVGADCVNFLFRGELIAVLEMVVNSEIGAAMRCLGTRRAPVPEEWSVDEARSILFGFKGEYPFDSALKPSITEWLEQVKQASTSGPSVLDGKYPDKYCEIQIQPRVYLGHGYLDRAKLFAKIYALRETGRVVIHFNWEGGVTPGPHDVAILDGQTLIIDMPWKVKELRADVYDLQWWDCVLKTSKGCTVEIGRLTIVGLPNDD